MSYMLQHINQLQIQEKKLIEYIVDGDHTVLNDDIYRIKDKKYNSYDDKPAIELADEKKELHVNGLLHRENSKLVVECASNKA
jgi:hypothetical protein